jgi:hypothetical protein
MSAAIFDICGVTNVRPEALVSLLECLVRAADPRTTLKRVAVTITPETAFFETRGEAIERFRCLGMHNLAGAIVRRKTRPGDLLLIAIGDEAPTLKSIAMAPVRAALARRVKATS